MNLFRNESSDAKHNAQRNLEGRTHYVDDGSLRFHKSRILMTRVVSNGLLFALIESCALDMNNTKRGFRYVVFNVFGTVVARPKLEDSYRTHKAAEKGMWAKLNELDAKALTLAAIESATTGYLAEMDSLRKTVEADTTRV